MAPPQVFAQLLHLLGGPLHSAAEDGDHSSRPSLRRSDTPCD